MNDGTVLVVGGSAGLGLATARHYLERGYDVAITSRDADRAGEVASELGGGARGIALDVSEPASIAAALEPLGLVRHVVVSAVERDENTASAYDIDRATRLVVMKLVGYTEVVHTLVDRMDEDSSVVLFGGLAKDRPYPGSTTVSTVNGGVMGLVHTLAVELAPIRVNAIHPAIVGDTAYWEAKPPGVLDALRDRTPLGRLVETADIVHAVAFLLENRAVTGANLDVDGGWLLA